MIKLGKYKHFKGNEYQVISIAHHSETLKEFVVYKPLYKSELSDVWIRPIEMFEEKVVFEGKEVTRFTYIGE